MASACRHLLLFLKQQQQGASGEMFLLGRHQGGVERVTCYTGMDGIHALLVHFVDRLGLTLDQCQGQTNRQDYIRYFTEGVRSLG